jgi:RHS repeat-associated protein
MLYFYDPQGERVGKQQGDTLEGYVYDPQGHMISVHDGSTNLLRAELYTPQGRHVATWGPNPNGQYPDPYPSGLFWNHADWLGTHRVRSDSTGTAREWCTDTPYGMNLNCVGQSDSSPMHFTGKQRDWESGLDNFGARYFGGGNSLGRFMSPDPLLSSGRPWDPQTWNRYSYARNNPLAIVDPTGLYDLNNTCAADDKKCNKQFRRHARDLAKGLKNLQKKVDKMKDGPEKTRLQAALKAFGTQGDNNGVNVSFGATKSGAAGETDPIYNGVGAKETYNVTLDPTKIDSRSDYAIDAAHEGTHVGDFETELENPTGQPELSLFSLEYRGYQTSAWAAQALGYENLSVRGVQIWNSSWAAVDRQTSRDKGITQVVVDKDHPETTPHNPWPN